MKFYEKYPDAKIDDEFYDDGDAVFKSSILSACAVCKTDNHRVLTSFCSIGFEGMPVCSTECLAKMWSDLEEANKEANRKYGPPKF